MPSGLQFAASCQLAVPAPPSQVFSTAWADAAAPRTDASPRTARSVKRFVTGVMRAMRVCMAIGLRRTPCVAAWRRPLDGAMRNFHATVVSPSRLQGVHSARVMTIPPTQLTLIARLQDPKDQEAWQRFEARYRELVVRFSTRQGLQPTDAEDVAQTVFGALFRAMPRFTLDAAKGRFRSYLFRVVRNEISRVRARESRPAGAAAALPIVEGVVAGGDARRAQVAELSERAFEEEWINHHYRIAMAEIRRTFAPESVAIFERLMRGEPVEAIARDCATSTQAVHKVKQRIRDKMKALVEQQIAEEA
ncbi:MAG: sigma-70 family RNA polymerase sigma factor [Phycisphaera sp.]|nr:sigma-70 family RNA polymerase sigma factor [Phycisphaera sp.]